MKNAGKLIASLLAAMLVWTPARADYDYADSPEFELNLLSLPQGGGAYGVSDSPEFWLDLRSFVTGGGAYDYADSSVFPLDLYPVNRVWGDSGEFAFDSGGVWEPAGFEGMVKDYNTGLGVVGATVSLTGESNATTDSEGIFSFGDPAAGTKTLTVTHPDYYQVSKQVTVTENSGSQLSIVMISKGDTTNPVVVDITSNYCGNGQHVYYLDGISLNQTFTASIDWNGHTPGTVRWVTPTGTYDQPCSTPVFAEESRQFNVGTEFGVGGKLQVIAISGDLSQSAAMKVNFDVIESPPCIPHGLLQPNRRGGNTLTYNGTFSLQWPNFDAELPDNPNVANPENEAGIKSIGACSFDTIVAVEAELSGEGACTIKLETDALKAKDAFKIGGIGVDVQVWANIYLNYEDQWLPGGGIGGSFSTEKKVGPKYWIVTAGPVPVPFFLKGVFEAILQAELGLQEIGGPDGFVFAGEFSPEVSIEVILGCGISDVAAVEGFLKGTLGLTAQFPDTPVIKEHFFTLDGGVRAYFLIFKYENNLLHFEWPGEEQAAMMAMAMPLEADRMEVMDRDYLNQNYAVWQAESEELPRMDMTGIQISVQSQPGSVATEETLQSNIFGQSDPQLQFSNGMQCLVWLYDDPCRNSLDRTMLMYSVNDGSGWTVPAAIEDDGTADFGPSLAIDPKGNFICVWADASQLYPDGMDLIGVADKLDISAAVYDPVGGTWTSTSLTTSAGLDYNPKCGSHTNGQMFVTWVHDDNSDMLGELGPATNSIDCSQWDGVSWSDPQIAATTSGIITYSDIVYIGTDQTVVFSLDTDSDLETDSDNELFILDDSTGSWSVPTQLTSDVNADTNPQFVQSATDVLLLWARDGQIVSSDDLVALSTITEVIGQEGSSGQRSFVSAVSPTDNISVIWNDPSEAGADLYTSTYDTVMGIWSDVVQMTDNREMERSVSAVYLGSNILSLAYNKVHIIENSGLIDASSVDLCVGSYEISSDVMTVEDSLVLSDPNAAPGDSVMLSVNVLNQGDVSVSDIPVAFYLGNPSPDNQIGETQVISGALAATEYASVSIPWILPETTVPLMITAVVDPDTQIEDRDRSNNSNSTYILMPDLLISEIVVKKTGPKQRTIIARVMNIGVTQAANVSISFKKNAKDGEPLTSFLIPALAGGGFQDVVFVWDISSENSNSSLVPVFAIVDQNNNIMETQDENNVFFAQLRMTDLADLNDSGVVDIEDLEMLISKWLEEMDSQSGNNPLGDDSVVNLQDFLRLAEKWMSEQTWY